MVNSSNFIIIKPNLIILIILNIFCKQGQVQSAICEIRQHILKVLHFYHCLNTWILNSTADIKRLWKRLFHEEGYIFLTLLKIRF